jgi:predicted RND superfamily exporter protein
VRSQTLGGILDILHLAKNYNESYQDFKTIGESRPCSPAILHGGITTFLALVFLSLSESHIFVIFFKIVSMTVVFGLFHGLLYLPVMLMIFGSSRIDDDDDDKGTNIIQGSPIVN